jgi:GxxExxY protein
MGIDMGEEQDMQDHCEAQRQDMQDKLLIPSSTEQILHCCFEVMNSLGSGFLESVYKNALIIALIDHGLQVITDRSFDVVFRKQKVGLFIPDLIVNNTVIVELKCCEHLLSEHQAQLINYLAVTNIPTGILVNFQKRRLEYKRVYHPAYPAGAPRADPAHPVPSPIHRPSS